MAQLGGTWAQALARKDFDALASLMHPEIDFRGMTPRKNWEGDNPDEIVQGILRHWFEDSDHIDELLSLEGDDFADCERVGYRFQVTTEGKRYVVEQQAYLQERDGKIGWMRVLCSGFRPLD
jgi:hypothetical protein